MKENWKHFVEWNKPDTVGHSMGFHLHGMSRISKFLETVASGLPGAREKGWWVGQWGTTANGNRRLSFGGDKIFWNELAVMVTQLYKYTKNHWIIHFKKGNLLVCELDLKFFGKKKGNHLLAVWTWAGILPSLCCSVLAYKM